MSKQDKSKQHYGHGTECPQCKSGEKVIYISGIRWDKWISRQGEKLHLCQKCMWIFDEYGEGQTI